MDSAVLYGMRTAFALPYTKVWVDQTQLYMRCVKVSLARVSSPVWIRKYPALGPRNNSAQKTPNDFCLIRLHVRLTHNIDVRWSLTDSYL